MNDRGNRTYHVSDERLREFAKLTAAQKLAWVEQCSTFIRLARLKPAKPVNQTDFKSKTAT
jgi:hypothetical protein